MPNWTENRLRITGPVKDRDAFVRKACHTYWADDVEKNEKPIEECTKKEVIERVAAALVEEKEKTCLSFTAFVAPPKGAGNDWCSEHWGTKWDASNPVMDHDSKRTKYVFETAWAPPFGALHAMAQQHPTLTFDLRYWEGGMGFSGHTIVKNKDVKVDDYRNDYRGGRGG